MPSSKINELSSKLQEQLGLPTGMITYTPFPFQGMNQQDSRSGMEDQEFYWRENFIRIGRGKLRTVWDRGAAIYTAPTGKTIVYFYFFNITDTNYCSVFLSDGTAVQINTSTLATKTISSTIGTFYVGSQLPACAQWGSQYLIIVNNITPNNYWIWDGNALYYPGTLGPVISLNASGSGYTSSPSIVVTGGSGSGAVFSVTEYQGSVVNVILTNPGTGYEPTDTIQLIFSGGGSDTGAVLTAVLAANTISSISVTNGGTGYASATTTVSISGGGGSGATATPIIVSGVITGVTLSNKGSGYTSTPTVTIIDSATNPGTGATAVALLGSGVLSSVAIVNGGSGYAETPTLTVTGGGGSGAACTATLTDGAITGVSVTAGGSGYTRTPQIVVESGINNAASATPTLMPFGVSGSSVEVYQQRAWITHPNQQGNQQNGGTFLVTAPDSITDFSTSDGGLTYVSSSPFLKQQYTTLKQANGYLYPIGDSSVDTIGNVQSSENSSNSTVTTTFNYQNTDPQSGSSWRDTVVNYGGTIIFVNKFGVFGLYGAKVTKISAKIDELFINAIFPPTSGAVVPCAAVANIFGQKTLVVLLTIKDPLSSEYRTIMLGWDERDWFVLTQSSTPIFINTQEVDSNLSAWGTEGTTLLPMFNSASSSLRKKISTKMYGADTQILLKQSQMVVLQATDNSLSQSGINLSKFTIDNEFGSYDMPNQASIASPWPKSAVYSAKADEVVGTNLGLTLESSSPDFTINFLGIGATNWSSVYGSQYLVGQTGE